MKSVGGKRNTVMEATRTLTVMSALRRQKGISQQELAKLVKIHQSEVSWIENRLIEPRPDVRERIADALDVVPSVLTWDYVDYVLDQATQSTKDVPDEDQVAGVV